jgi:nucleoside-diphosphate-sugar epimerase
MKIVVIGGTGLIGSKTVAILRQRGHEVVAASPNVNTITGESFSEFPGDRHAVSANASDTEPARLLAVFIVNTDETVLATPSQK